MGTPCLEQAARLRREQPVLLALVVVAFLALWYLLTLNGDNELGWLMGPLVRFANHPLESSIAMLIILGILGLLGYRAEVWRGRGVRILRIGRWIGGSLLGGLAGGLLLTLGELLACDDGPVCGVVLVVGPLSASSWAAVLTPGIALGWAVKGFLKPEEMPPGQSTGERRST